jgi:hypothetical protein
MTKKIYKERASMIGKIMTNPRSKSQKYSDTMKKRVQEKILEDQFNVKSEFWSRYTEKGIQVEDESILMFGRITGRFGCDKNEKSFENDYFTGTPDIIIQKESLVVDIKSSWSASSFPFFNDDDDIPSKDYIYQLHAYMDLTGMDNALLAYCLVDTPEEIIQDEIRRRAWKDKILDVTEEYEDQVRSQMSFDHIPEEMRLRIFKVDKDEDLIHMMKERVVLCNEYANECLNKLNLLKEKNHE